MSGKFVRPLCAFGYIISVPNLSFRTFYDVAFSYDPEDPTSPKKTGWLVLSGHDDPDPSHFIVHESFDKFVLDMMGS